MKKLTTWVILFALFIQSVSLMAAANVKDELSATEKGIFTDATVSDATLTDGTATDATFSDATPSDATLTDATLTDAGLLGDVDGQKGITSSDARLILRAAVGLNEIPLEYYYLADINCDGAVTAADARLALRCAVGLEGTSLVSYKILSSQAPTCKENGSVSVATGNGKVTISVSPAGHSYITLSDIPASCTENGVINSLCSVCGDEKTVTLRAKGHNATAVTCTDNSVCTVCNAVLASATGHNYKKADCTNPATCKVCGKTDGKALGHNYSAATCIKRATCSICGETKGRLAAHDYSKATYEKPATCKVCGATTGDCLGVTYSSEGYKITTTKDGYTYVDGILIVNKTYSIPSGYAPGGLTSECSAAFSQLKQAAAKDGISIFEVSGYRSYSLQQSLYNRYSASDGQAAADRYSARPGHSEHQTGLALDVNSLSSSFENTKEGKWLAAHCAEYGFIIRYPKGKEGKTGYIYEPWHIRYVGKDIAKKITDSGLCLEEYYGLTSEYK